MKNIINNPLEDKKNWKLLILRRKKQTPIKTMKKPSLPNGLGMNIWRVEKTL